MINGKNTIDNAEEERQSESHYSFILFYFHFAHVEKQCTYSTHDRAFD